MTKKALVLDTTYILPLFGIDVSLDGISPRKMKKIIEGSSNNFLIRLPEICLMEVNYKLNSIYRKTGNEEVLDRYSIALPTILNSKSGPLLVLVGEPPFECNRIELSIIFMLKILIQSLAYSFKTVS